MANSKLINETPVHTNVIQFGLTDEKGRMMGIMVRTNERTYEAVEGRGYWAHEAGHYFVANCQVTRDGNRFGAGQDCVHFATPEERDAYVARRVDQAMKKAKAREQAQTQPVPAAVVPEVETLAADQPETDEIPFTKGETVVYVACVNRESGTFAFRRAIVESCGQRVMTLKRLDGTMMGNQFRPKVGFNWSARTGSLRGKNQPGCHYSRSAVFHDMPDETAMALCLKCSADFLAYEHKVATARSDGEEGGVAYRQEMKRRADRLASMAPNAHNLDQ